MTQKTIFGKTLKVAALAGLLVSTLQVAEAAGPVKKPINMSSAQMKATQAQRAKSYKRLSKSQKASLAALSAKDRAKLTRLTAHGRSELRKFSAATEGAANVDAVNAPDVDTSPGVGESEVGGPSLSAPSAPVGAASGSSFRGNLVSGAVGGMVAAGTIYAGPAAAKGIAALASSGAVNLGAAAGAVKGAAVAGAQGLAGAVASPAGLTVLGAVEGVQLVRSVGAARQQRREIRRQAAAEGMPVSNAELRAGGFGMVRGTLRNYARVSPTLGVARMAGRILTAPARGLRSLSQRRQQRRLLNSGAADISGLNGTERDNSLGGEGTDLAPLSNPEAIQGMPRAPGALLTAGTDPTAIDTDSEANEVADPSSAAAPTLTSAQRGAATRKANKAAADAVTALNMQGHITPAEYKAANKAIVSGMNNDNLSSADSANRQAGIIGKAKYSTLNSKQKSAYTRAYNAATKAGNMEAEAVLAGLNAAKAVK